MSGFRRLLRSLWTEAVGEPGERSFSYAVFAAALLAYLPGICWGLPSGASPDQSFPWGSDELAPLGAIGELYRVFLAPHLTFNPQYPLFHYIVQAMFVTPYIAFLAVTGQVSGVTPVYPFGLVDPSSALAVTTVLSRIPSALMGAGTVVAAGRVGHLLWSARTGRLTALVSSVGYAMFYYSRTSNVDMPALFWTALGFVALARVMRDGLTTGRAVAFGTLAAIATGTKDASFFAFLLMVPGLVPWHEVRRMSIATQWAHIWRPLLIGAAASAVTYSAASGFIFRPERFYEHVRFITRASASFVYPGTLRGTLGLLRETSGFVWATLSTPVLLLAFVGIGRATVSDRRTLLLLLPGIGVIVGTIIPVHFVNFRFIILPAFCLSLVAGYGLDWLVSKSNRRTAWIATVLLLGWPAIRGIDLTHQMLADSRYGVAKWFDREARSGETVAYFGARQKLPRLDGSIHTVFAGEWCTPEDWKRERPEFVIVVPQQHHAIVHEWGMAEHVYRGLVEGSLGYRRVVYTQAPMLFSRRPVPWVNPPVQVFVRRDRVTPSMPAATDLAPPVLGPLETALGLELQFPSGLVHNTERASFPCEKPGGKTSRGT